MRRVSVFRSVLLSAVLAGTTVLSGGLADASVPGSDFTETACEEYSDSIARLYSAGLDRDAEQAGFDFWLHEYSTGKRTFWQIADYFANSPEFQANYGLLTNEQFVRQLYRNILNREGEDEGVDHWTQWLADGGTPAGVLMLLAESPENIGLTGTSQPALGEFNTGLPEGAWRCGPSLAGSLLRITDLDTRWTPYTSEVILSDAICIDLLLPPAGSDFILFTEPSDSEIVIHGVHAFATDFGAKQFMTRGRAEAIACAGYVEGLGHNLIAEVQMTPRGDDMFAIRIQYVEDGSRTVDTYLVAIRFGNVISIVENTARFLATIETADAYVSLASTQVLTTLGS